MKPTAFPLFWPPDQARTRIRRRAKFQVTTDVARRDMLLELQRLGALNVTVSTNIPLRRDGQPYADGDPDDAGVAVYFLLDQGAGQVEHVIACDAWDLVKDNYRAIAKTVEAVRGIERWGATELMKRMFSSFRMLRAAGPAPRAWHVVLDVPVDAPAAAIRDAYRELAKRHHPDNGGSHETMAEINRAFEEAQRLGYVA